MVDARVAANRFIELARADGRELTPMQILKLVYIAHGWTLALYNRALIHQNVEAWQYGPVIPELYSAMRSFRGAGVRGPLPLGYGSRAEPLSTSEADMVSQVYGLYGKKNGVALSNITHAKGTPWSQVYTPEKFGVVIPQDLIADHYTRLSRERSEHPD